MQASRCSKAVGVKVNVVKSSFQAGLPADWVAITGLQREIRFHAGSIHGIAEIELHIGIQVHIVRIVSW